MSNMSSTGKRYEDASSKFEDAYNKYAGEAGLNSATTYAKTQAQEQANTQSGLAGSRAGQQAAQQARSAGMSKAAAADMAAGSASDATANAYGSTYNNAYNTSLSGALQNNQAAVNARTQQTQLAQQEDQNAYNRAWGNVGGGLSTAGSLLGAAGVISDERLKTFKEVSSKLDSKKPDSYKLLKVTYTKKKE